MRTASRGGPCDQAARIERAERLLAGRPGAAGGPLYLLVAVLTHQASRVDSVAFPALSGGEAPLIDGDRAAEQIVYELPRTIAALRGQATPALAEAAGTLARLAPSEAAACVETWLDDVALIESRLGFWLQAAAGPILEVAARSAAVPEGWQGRACPVCGGPPQVSVIAEESGEFMAGSPRSLVCGRCATWWRFPRATCTVCGEDNSAAQASYHSEDRRVARVDVCATCRAYIKTFDLREDGALHVVPLVDDVATLTLDVWAQEHGYARASRSLAGV